MAEKVTALRVRQQLGDMLNRVALRHDEFVIERKGKPLAALVPVGKLEQVRRVARRHALEFLEQQKGGEMSEAEALALSLLAKHATRRRSKRRLRTNR